MSHRQISYTKSAIRLLGYVTLLAELTMAVAILVIAEIIGVLEEQAMD